jgi:OmpA-OmpF porin, OOP family
MGLWFCRCVVGTGAEGRHHFGNREIMDAKKLLCLVVLASVAGTSHADNFFVNTNLGGSNYSPQPLVNLTDWHSQTEALRFGYQWTSDAFSYGLETGYANLGHSYRIYAHIIGVDRFSERIDGAMLGANLKYSLPKGFYISGRGGFFRSTNHQVDKTTFYNYYDPSGPIVTRTLRGSTSGIGSYFGIGVGYDFNQSFGVGLSYDRYLAHVIEESVGGFAQTSRVDTYTLAAEYRF